MSKFDVKDVIDSTLYSIYNVISDCLFFVNFSLRKILKKNEAFKNIHVGQQCFILGTGPSLNALTEDELNVLRNETVFGVNSLYKSEITSSVKPKYYALMDNLYWEQWNHTFSEVLDRYKDAPPTFITDIRAKHLLDDLGVIAPIFIYSKKYPTSKMSSDIDSNIFAAMNVISYSILTAIHMGFKEIYLLGCDYNAFCTAGQGHCYDDKSEVSQSNYSLAFYLKFYWITTEFHYLIAKLAREKGVSIVNFTPNSLLDAYPRMQFFEHFRVKHASVSRLLENQE